MPDPNTQTSAITYYLRFEDQSTISFVSRFDRQDYNYLPPACDNPPAWTRLTFEQCSNCPLSVQNHSHCPVAINLVSLIELCNHLPSFTAVDVEVVTAERRVCVHSTLQRVLSSILGLIIATSPCPHTAYLKPMARFHLPLASEEETVYRSCSSFLLAQYFLHKAGLKHSLELTELTAIYQNLQIINKALVRRLKAAIKEDASVNAIILLDVLSKSVTWSIEEGLEDLRYLFKGYGID